MFYHWRVVQLNSSHFVNSFVEKGHSEVLHTLIIKNRERKRKKDIQTSTIDTSSHHSCTQLSL